MYEPPSLVALGRAVRDCRLMRGLSQRELADDLSLHRAYVGHVEQGRQNVTFKTLSVIARHLDVPMQEIMERADAHEAALRATAPD